MKPGSMDDVQTVSDRQHVGNVYLLRGFIGIFSTGIDHLGEEINTSGVRAEVYQDDQWGRLADAIAARYASQTNAPARQPLVLIGHSYGADDVVRIARKLQASHVTVDLLVTIDPTTPPTVPTNVLHTVNLYRPNGLLDALPFFRGIPLSGDPGGHPIDNINIRTDPRHLMEPGTDHFNIEKRPEIHAVVIHEVLAVCPTQSQWARIHALSDDIALFNAGHAASISNVQPPTGAKKPLTSGKTPPGNFASLQ